MLAAGGVPGKGSTVTVGPTLRCGQHPWQLPGRQVCVPALPALSPREVSDPGAPGARYVSALTGPTFAFPTPSSFLLFPSSSSTPPPPCLVFLSVSDFTDTNQPLTA